MSGWCRRRVAAAEWRGDESGLEFGEALGPSPQMTLGTYAHVIEEVRGAERRPAVEKISSARAQVADHGLGQRANEALG